MPQTATWSWSVGPFVGQLRQSVYQQLTPTWLKSLPGVVDCQRYQFVISCILYFKFKEILKSIDCISKVRITHYTSKTVCKTNVHVKQNLYPNCSSTRGFLGSFMSVGWSFGLVNTTTSWGLEVALVFNSNEYKSFKVFKKLDRKNHSGC
jgi:hypothetical protein